MSVLINEVGERREREGGTRNRVEIENETFLVFFFTVKEKKNF